MTSDTTPTPETLHRELVDKLRASGAITSEHVANAVAAVPRHLFLPDVAAEDAYANKYVVTHRDTNGDALSSASLPSLVAGMLDELDVQPGMQVLEIGAGTGYNAALLDELLGPSGEVTTIDIEPEVTEAACRHLAAAGYPRVHVVAGDGSHGNTTHAPYDRIIATTGVWDIPPAWWQQLAPGGRMVIPLRWRGLTRALTLDYVNGHLVARAMKLCGFIPMQGQEQQGECSLPLAEGVMLFFDDDATASTTDLATVLDEPSVTSWSGVIIDGQTPLDGIWMRLSIAEPGTARLVSQPSPIDAGHVSPAIPPLNPAVIDGESLAYLTIRRLPTDEGQAARIELGAICHGPAGHELAERMCAQIRMWNTDRDALPQATVVPAETPDDHLPEGQVIDKYHSRLVLALA